MSNFQKPNRPPTRLKDLREFPAVGGDDQTVEDNFDHFKMSPEEEEAIRQARKDKFQGVERVTPQTKTRVEYLVGIGKMTREVKIGNTTFLLRTLKSKEQKAVYLTLVDVTNKVDEAYNIKYWTLAYSLIRIDDQPFELMVKINDLEDKVRALSEMEEGVTDKLYSEYVALKSESDASFLIKNDEDVKEVSEALGK